MKRIITLLIILGIAVSVQILVAQPNRRNRQERKVEKLTTYQIKVVKAIIAKYDNNSLSSEDAIAIIEELREEGINLGPETDEVIKSAGIDPEKLRELAPRPDNNQGERQGNNTRDRNGTRAENSQIDKSNESPVLYIPKSSLDIFHLKSSAVSKNNFLSNEFTGDGEGISMPLEWSNVPEETKYFALNLWHLPNQDNKTDVKSYWVLYDIPGNVRSLPANTQNIGIAGDNDKGDKDYDPMKSKGPGVKVYNLTLYALSEKPVFSTDKVNREELLKAIKDITIEECTLQYLYERMGNK